MTNFESKLKEAAHAKVQQALSLYMDTGRELSIEAPTYGEITELVVDTVVKELSSAEGFYETSIDLGDGNELTKMIEVTAIASLNAKTLLLERELTYWKNKYSCYEGMVGENASN